MISEVGTITLFIQEKTNILSIGFASQCSDIIILCFFESVLCLKIFTNKTEPECKIVPRLLTVLVLAMYQ